jgi:hypothetical protein
MPALFGKQGSCPNHAEVVAMNRTANSVVGWEVPQARSDRLGTLRRIRAGVTTESPSTLCLSQSGTVGGMRFCDGYGRSVHGEAQGCGQQCQAHMTQVDGIKVSTL